MSKSAVRSATIQHRGASDEPTGTKLSLIEAAGELIAERGLKGTSTRAIAEKAHSNIGCIHYYFGGKENLYWAAVEHVLHRRITEQNARLILPEKPTPQEISDALAELVRRRLAASCGPDVPAWHNRLLWRNLIDELPEGHAKLTERVFRPAFERFAEVARRAKPRASGRQIRLLLYQLVSQLIFYSHFQPKVLKELAVEAYSTRLLAEVGDHVARSLARMLDLPDPSPRGD